MVPLKLDHGQQLHLRSNALETASTLRELFDLHGWPTEQLESPRYVFLRWAAKIEKGTMMQVGLIIYCMPMQMSEGMYTCFLSKSKTHVLTCSAHFRPNGFALDAFLLLLGLASSYPHSILFLREADLASAATPASEEPPALPVTKQSLQRQWSRALTVTIGATIRTFPAALLLNSRLGS